MAKRKQDQDPNRLVSAQAFIREKGERSLEAEINRMMFGAAPRRCTLDMIERVIVAKYVLDGSLVVQDISKEVIDRVDDEELRSLAIERVRQIICDDILTDPDTGQAIFRRITEMKEQHKRNSLESLLAGPG